jgi:hypothetical protein
MEIAWIKKNLKNNTDLTGHWLMGKIPLAPFFKGGEKKTGISNSYLLFFPSPFNKGGRSGI